MKTIIYGVLAVLVVAILYVGFNWYTDKQVAERQQAITAANVQATQLDMEGAGAMYAAMAAAETDPLKRARLLTLEGFARNSAGEYSAGIPLLKSVVADPNVPNKIKAEALLAMLYVSFRNDMTPLQLIFNDGGIYAEALAGGDINSNDDLLDAVTNLYSKADSYYPYAFSQLALTVRPVYFLLNIEESSDAEKETARQAIEAHLTRADELLGSEMREQNLYASELDNVIRGLFPMTMHLRLRALEALALEDETQQPRTEEYYTYILGVFDYYEMPMYRAIESYMRFYYASYLARVHGEIRAQEISQVMAPVYDETNLAVSNSYSIWKFFETELANPASLETSHIRRIAEHDPAFKQFLINKGWWTE